MAIQCKIDQIFGLAAALAVEDMIRSMLLLAVGTTVAGCASVDSQRASLVSGQPCCATISLSHAVPLVMTSVAVEISDDIQPVAFVTGNSHYAVIDLGVSDRRPHYLGIRQAPALTNVYTSSGSWLPTFIPAVTFLSDSGLFISAAEQSDPVAPPVPCERALGCGMYSASVAVPVAARFAVIHTDAKRVGETSVEPMTGAAGASAGTMIKVGAAFVPVGGGNVPMSRAMRMASGKLEVFGLN